MQRVCPGVEMCPGVESVSWCGGFVMDSGVEGVSCCILGVAPLPQPRC